jgi:hypothetical protein
MTTRVLPQDPITQLMQQHYGALRARVIAMADGLLRQKGCQLARHDIDQAYNDAWMALMDAFENGKAPAEVIDADRPPTQLRS